MSTQCDLRSLVRNAVLIFAEKKLPANWRAKRKNWGGCVTAGKRAILLRLLVVPDTYMSKNVIRFIRIDEMD